jgi:m7GpppX diphosphatase
MASHARAAHRMTDHAVDPRAIGAALREFAIDAVINTGRDDARGTVVARGRFDDDEALVKVSRAHLPSDVDGLQRVLSRAHARLRAPYSGAEYMYYTAAIDRDVREGEDGDVHVDVICPGWLTSTSRDAREALMAKHIARSSAQKMILIRETPEIYRHVHETYIAGVPDAATAWVYKILSLEKERERLLHADDDFLLNTDPKWQTHPDCATTDRASWFNHPSVMDLYCLGLCQRRDVRSLRDLRAEHLPMLRAMLRVARDVIARVYGVHEEDMRVFVHYPPQFYHFHVHYQALSAQEVGCQTERAHLLEDIIDNIERDGDFYAKANISVKMGERDKLMELYRAHTMA